jgi:hypothetical protein
MLLLALRISWMLCSLALIRIVDHRRHLLRLPLVIPSALITCHPASLAGRLPLTTSVCVLCDTGICSQGKRASCTKWCKEQTP